MRNMKDEHDDAVKRGHPYLSGNFAPVKRTLPLTPCTYSGAIPDELVGGEYVRNGGNPVTNEALGRDAHWFDGDGMLSGVLFRRCEDGKIQPEFTNQYILTDLYLSTLSSPSLQTPILLSIATLVNPLRSLFTIIFRIFRTIALVILSHLPGSQQAINKISVANTGIIYHDGRALATCESGPPMQISLPSLETVDWFTGPSTSNGEDEAVANAGFGGGGLLNFMREWTTAHPRNDPNTKELLLFHSTFVAPFVHYTILKSTYDAVSGEDIKMERPFFQKPVPGVSSAKMMHDFGTSTTHTIIPDLPLSLDPLNLAKNKPIVAYDPIGRSRFGVFPRYNPEEVRWFETKACCIFHIANSWNTSTIGGSRSLDTDLVNMLACRLTSASLVYSAGDVAAPQPVRPFANPEEEEEEQCRLYYYQFELSQNRNTNTILHQWALSAIPFEFPSLRDSCAMSAAKYVYGCSVSDASFGAALGRGVKINSLVKMDVESLIARGKRSSPTQISGCVDTRSVAEILSSTDPDDPIQIFKMPDGWYAQESRFVPKENGDSEDDGWIITYAFDESQLADDGECRRDAKSELWIIDARSMKHVVAKIRLPQRVPYGMHGNWFSEQEIQEQRPVMGLRSLPSPKRSAPTGSLSLEIWLHARRAIESFLQ